MAAIDVELETADHRVRAGDGYPLAVTVYESPAATSAVLVNSATAVPRSFYRHFARHLASRGIRVVCYDYRGIGDSRPESLGGFAARMRDWALLDMTALLDWVKAELTPQKIVGVGHSFGGQAAGLIENGKHFDALVTMSAQSGYWRIQGGLEPLKVGLAVWVLMPLLSRAFGYFPWSRLGASEDLPKGVALEWAGWARDPDYLLGDAGLPLDRFAKFEAPVLAYSFADDDWGRPAAVDAMMRAYPNVERRHIEPGDFGLPHIGHFGYFRRGSEPLWDDTLAWIQQLSSASGSQLVGQ